MWVKSKRKFLGISQVLQVKVVPLHILEITTTLQQRFVSMGVAHRQQKPLKPSFGFPKEHGRWSSDVILLKSTTVISLVDVLLNTLMLCENKCEFNKHVTPDYRKIYMTKFTHQRKIDVWNTKNLRPLTLRQ